MLTAAYQAEINYPSRAGRRTAALEKRQLQNVYAIDSTANLQRFT